METAWRKINVDAYDEDVLEESELYDPDPRDPATVLSDARQKANTVRSALAKSVLLPQLISSHSTIDMAGETIKVLF
jgi:hypothetical protein